MKLRTVGILAGLLAVGAFAAPLPSFAETAELTIIVDTAPPPAKESTPPMPEKAGYVWSSGYWNWSGTAYVWTEGSWVAVVEPTKKWIEPTWIQHGTKWHFTPGHWG